MPSAATPLAPESAGMSSVSQASSVAMGNAELAAASSIALVMFNAAQAQQGCQQIELSAVGVTCLKIIAAAGI